MSMAAYAASLPPVAHAACAQCRFYRQRRAARMRTPAARRESNDKQYYDEEGIHTLHITAVIAEKAADMPLR